MSETESEERLPSGIALSYNQLIPLNSPFKELYDNLFGASLEYILGIDDGISIEFGVYLVARALKENSDVSVFLNSYTAGVRLWIPGLKIFWPYIGLKLRITWCGERGEDESGNFFAYGADGFIGCTYMIRENVDIFLQYNYIWSRVWDENGTNISGHNLSIGVIYGLWLKK